MRSDIIIWFLQSWSDPEPVNDPPTGQMTVVGRQSVQYNKCMEFYHLWSVLLLHGATMDVE